MGRPAMRETKLSSCMEGVTRKKKSAKPRSFSATAHRSKTEVDSNENIAAASGDNMSIRQKNEKSKG